MNNPGPGLTEQELSLATTARFDLGSGYPQISPPEFVRRLFRDDRLEDLGLMTAPMWSADKQALVVADLADSVERTLKFNPRDCTLRSTFSGSVAVDRAITACLRRSRQHGYERLEVVTTSPSIDIMQDFLAERSDITTVFSDSMDEKHFPEFDLDHILSLLDSPLASGTTRAALLTSPENPTGQCWSGDELLAISAVCEKRGFSLVVDHCFYLAGVHADPPAAMWQFASAIENWIAIWDTGKTFGLNGDKLGFLLSSPAMARNVDDALTVMQFDVSRRQKLFFTELLRAAPFFDYVGDLRTKCISNLDALNQLASTHGLACFRPRAGSLALIGIESLGLTDSEFQAILLQSGVGMVTGSSFFHGATYRNDLMRLALAREPDIFAQALEITDSVLYSLRNRLTPHIAGGDR